jgi:hypothetical protein
MHQFGISIYPDHGDPAMWMDYVERAAREGVTRVFTCLLSPEGTPEAILERFKPVIHQAQALGMTVIADVAPAVMERLGITPSDVSYLKRLGVGGYRLDEGLDAATEAALTRDDSGLVVELNGSVDSDIPDQILSAGGNPERLWVCHNFYPQRYTGLSWAHFQQCNAHWKRLGLRTAAFIGVNRPDAIGPWPLFEGLVTLEQHRDWPLERQARFYLAFNSVDDLLIANGPVSEDELTSLTKLNLNVVSLRLDEDPRMSTIEREILYEFAHQVRPDQGDYMIRSTMPRIVYAKASIPPRPARAFRKGDVVILNDAFGRYKGELHVILRDLPDDGRRNLVGTLSLDEQTLIPALSPHRDFRFLR